MPNRGRKSGVYIPSTSRPPRAGGELIGEDAPMEGLCYDDVVDELMVFRGPKVPDVKVPRSIRTCIVSQLSGRLEMGSC